MRTPIYERMNFTISFPEDGKVKGFWLVHERIRADYKERLDGGYVKPDYVKAIHHMDSLIKLQSVVAVHGTLDDWLDVMVECSYHLQMMAKEFVRPDKENNIVEVVVDISAITEKEMVAL